MVVELLLLLLLVVLLPPRRRSRPRKKRRRRSLTRIWVLASSISATVVRNDFRILLFVLNRLSTTLPLSLHQVAIKPDEDL